MGRQGTAKKGRAGGKKGKVVVPTRKEIRKEMRKAKKAKIDTYYKTKRQRRQARIDEMKLQKVHTVEEDTDAKKSEGTTEKQGERKKSRAKKRKDRLTLQKEQEDAQLAKLKKEMAKSRQVKLQEENKFEDENIEKLEKQLGLRKRKTLPGSFVADGLDYLLDICNTEERQKIAKVEQALGDSDSEFEEDLALVTGKKVPASSKTETPTEYADDAASNSDGSISSLDEEEDESPECRPVRRVEDKKSNGGKGLKKDEKEQIHPKKSKSKSEEAEEPGKFVRLRVPVSESGSVCENWEDEVQSECSNEEEEESREEETAELGENGVWEDIYGRMRDKQGNVISETVSNPDTYVPPARRAKNASVDENSKKRVERLKRQIKGHLNRLTERNIVSISNEFERLYAENSRHDMNETLISLMLESLVTPVMALERLAMEHCLLLACLHCKVGSDVGADVLQALAKKFDSLFNKNPDIENKELDNVILILCHLYNFKVVHARLVLDILHCLADRFGPKDLELVLEILKTAGFTLRKDDPAELRNMILKLQQLANAQAQSCNEARVRFMLEVLLAVKNNNTARMPGADLGRVEHFRKLLRTLTASSSGSTELSISLKDLLQAEERGRWWVVGSAWAGQGPEEEQREQQQQQQPPTGPSYSSQLLELARRQRMNTDVRRNIFCIIMTAQDYQEAFENLLQMGLKGQPAREIIYVTLDCCLQEKTFNRYYAHILQNFCEYDRNYKITMQASCWDKFRELDTLSAQQITNFTQLLTQLLIQGALSLWVFKVLDLAELNKFSMRLMRKVLLAVLMADWELCEAAFLRVSKSAKMRGFCGSLRVFLKRFVLEHMGAANEKKETLQDRIERVDTLLTTT